MAVKDVFFPLGIGWRYVEKYTFLCKPYYENTERIAYCCY